MKHFLISSMLMLCALNCWAQETKTSAKDSICVFDGTLTNVPDGTEIWVSVPNTDERIVFEILFQKAEISSIDLI